jgi:transposase
MGPRPGVPVVISIDPGVRTFATCYNPTAGVFTEHGKSGPFEAIGLASRTTTRRGRISRRSWGVGATITFLKRKAGRVEAKAAADRKRATEAKRAAAKPGTPELEHRAAVRERRKFVRKARKKRRAAARIRKRSRDVVADMHWRLAVELCRTADLILLPDFRPSNKVTKVDPTGKLRRLGKNTVTRMLGQAHATFKDRLLSKAEEYGVRAEIVREDFTSKTCGACGHIWDELDSKHVYHCPKCEWTLGRDENGARNVLIRHIADSGLRIN